MPSIFEATAGTKLGIAVPFDIVNQGEGNATPAKSDPVTVNAMSGTIRTANTNLASGDREDFTVSNSFVKRGDVVILNHSEREPSSTYAHGNEYVVQACAVTDGQFAIQMTNVGTAGHNEHLFINFTVLKAVTHS